MKEDFDRTFPRQTFIQVAMYPDRRGGKVAEDHSGNSSNTHSELSAF